jgi:hypothetical protein
VAIVGDPATLPAADAAAGDAYLFAVAATLLSGAVALGLAQTAPRATSESVRPAEALSPAASG